MKAYAQSMETAWNGFNLSEQILAGLVSNACRRHPTLRDTSLGMHSARYCKVISKQWKALRHPPKTAANLVVLASGSRCQAKLAWTDRCLRNLKSVVQYGRELWLGRSAWVEACLSKSSLRPLLPSWGDVMRPLLRSWKPKNKSSWSQDVLDLSVCSRDYLHQIWPSLDLSEIFRIVALALIHVLFRVWWHCQDRNVCQPAGKPAEPTTPAMPAEPAGGADEYSIATPSTPRSRSGSEMPATIAARTPTSNSAGMGPQREERKADPDDGMGEREEQPAGNMGVDDVQSVLHMHVRVDDELREAQDLAAEVSSVRHSAPSPEAQPRNRRKRR